MRVRDEGNTVYSVAEARKEWSTILNLVAFAGKEVEIEKNGKLVAKVVPPAEVNSKNTVNYREKKMKEFIKENAGSWAGKKWVDDWVKDVERGPRSYRDPKRKLL